MEQKQNKRVCFELTNTLIEAKMTPEMIIYLFDECSPKSVDESGESVFSLRKDEICHLLKLSVSNDTRNKLKFLSYAAEQGIHTRIHLKDPRLQYNDISRTKKIFRSPKTYIIALLGILILFCFVMFVVNYSKNHYFPFSDFPKNCNIYTSLLDMGCIERDGYFDRRLQFWMNTLDSQKISGFFIYTVFFLIQVLLYVINFKRTWVRDAIHWTLFAVALLANVWIYLEIADFAPFEDFVEICEYVFSIILTIILLPILLPLYGASSIFKRR